MPLSNGESTDIFHMHLNFIYIHVQYCNYISQKLPDYYNAIPLTDHRYIPKLCEPEEAVLDVELSRNIAQQTVLKQGKSTCMKLSTDMESAHHEKTVLEECYCMQFKIAITTFKHKLAILKVKECDLREEIKKLREERDALKVQERVNYSFAVFSRAHKTTLKYPVPTPRKSLNQTRCLETLHEDKKLRTELQLPKLSVVVSKPTPKPRGPKSAGGNIKPIRSTFLRVSSKPPEPCPSPPPRPKTAAAQDYRPSVPPRHNRRQTIASLPRKNSETFAFHKAT